jgi:predicted nucleic acid-binding protein
MPKVVISDASCLIILSKIGELDLLHLLYSQVYITPEIKSEFGESLPNWIIVETVRDKEYQKSLETKLDIGEASAIALAIEKIDSLVILDDLKARKVATELNLVFTGTLGVISKAKEQGYCDKIKPIIQKILQTNFRISRQVLNALLSRYGEN